MKKKALSLVLGLLVLLTFTNTAAALLADDFVLVYQTCSGECPTITQDPSGYIILAADDNDITDGAGQTWGTWHYNKTFYGGVKVTYELTPGGGSLWGAAIGIIVYLDNGKTYAFYHNLHPNYIKEIGEDPGVPVDQSLKLGDLETNVQTTVEINPKSQLETIGETGNIVKVIPYFEAFCRDTDSAWGDPTVLTIYNIEPLAYNVTFSLKDALTGQSLTG
ncbi:hypothetical protein DRN44_05920, partial [Thermococci archaeon]